MAAIDDYIEKYTERFLQNLRARNLSPNTIKAYQFELNFFHQYWKEKEQEEQEEDKDQDSPHADNSQDFYAFLDWSLQDRQVSAHSLARKIACFKTFFKFLEDEEILEKNFVKKIRTPKLPTRLPKDLPDPVVKEILKHPEASTKERNAEKRNEAILNLLMYTGMRLSELTQLNRSDIDMDTKTIRVIGKGDIERRIPLNAIVLESLQNYMETLEKDDRKAQDEENRPLFLSKQSKRLSNRAVQHLIRVCGEQLHFNERQSHPTPHKFRHTFATSLHQNNVSVPVIQQLLGHKSPSTTHVYIHTNKSELEKAVTLLS